MMFDIYFWRGLYVRACMRDWGRPHDWVGDEDYCLDRYCLEYDK